MYRTIDAAFWTDPKVRLLPIDGRLLFLYLITNPHTHVSGIYYLPRDFMVHETGLSHQRLDTLCNTLSTVGFCRFDRPGEVVWVINMMRYQGRGEKNLLSAARHIIEDLHYSPLIHDFAAYYPLIKPLIPDRVYDRGSAVRTPDQDQDQDQEQDQETDVPIVTFISLGEFGNVRLSNEQIEKLKIKLNGNFDNYVNRLDRWGAEEPGKFRKKKSHYATVLSWFDRDVKEGKVREERAESLEDDPPSRPEIHTHHCGICIPEHDWSHDDEMCFIDLNCVCDKALAERKARQGVKS